MLIHIKSIKTMQPWYDNYRIIDNDDVVKGLHRSRYEWTRLIYDHEISNNVMLIH
jgi:hypothetical protein